MIENIGRLGVVVVAHNSVDWLGPCLESVLDGTSGVRPKVIVVDNASTDESIRLVQRRYPIVTIVPSHLNLGFAGGANRGIQRADVDVVVVLNPDVTLEPRALSALLRAFEGNPRLAIAGCKLLYPDGKTVQHAGGRITYPLALADHIGYRQEDRGQFDRPREVDYVTGAAFAVRKAALEEIGYFDEGFFPAYFEEADLCYRARTAGYKIIYVPNAVAVHHESVTTGTDTPAYYHFYHRNRVRFVLKHYYDDQLWRDFRPAEEERLRGLGPSNETRALVAAYLDNLAVLEGRATFFADPSAVTPLPSTGDPVRLMRTLADLAERIGNGGGQRVNPKLKQIADRKDAVTRLRQSATLVEPAFVSSAPVVGPLIVWARTLWNSVSTKWYVRPVLQQQSDFNRHVVEVLDQLNAELTAELARVSRVLDRVVEQLDERNLDVNAPRESLRAIEEAVIESERLVVGIQRDVARLNLRLAQTEVTADESSDSPGQPTASAGDPSP